MNLNEAYMSMAVCVRACMRACVHACVCEGTFSIRLEPFLATAHCLGAISVTSHVAAASRGKRGLEIIVVQLPVDPKIA